MDSVEQWLSPDFWQQTLHSAVEWAIATAPRLLILLIGAWIGLKMYGVALQRLRTVLINRQPRADSTSMLEHEKRVNTLTGIVRKVGSITLWSMFIMLFLVEIGIDIGPLIAGAGVIGLAVGFGAQELVRDVITGFFNLMENHIRTGDVVEINGVGGLVENIGLRTVILRDLSGVVHVFQNGKIDTIANRTKEWSAMVFDVGVAYKESTDRVAAVMTRVAQEMQEEEAYGPHILEPLQILGVDAFGDNAVIIKARFRTVAGQQWLVGREYNRRLKYAFDAEGIEIPFPHRSLYWGDASKPVQLELKGGLNLPAAASVSKPQGSAVTASNGESRETEPQRRE